MDVWKLQSADKLCSLEDEQRCFTILVNFAKGKLQTLQPIWSVGKGGTALGNVSVVPGIHVAREEIARLRLFGLCSSELRLLFPAGKSDICHHSSGAAENKLCTMDPVLATKATQEQWSAQELDWRRYNRGLKELPYTACSLMAVKNDRQQINGGRIKKEDAVKAIIYEATSRLRDPVYGSAGTIFHLQKMVQELKIQVESMKAQVLQIKEQRDQLLGILMNVDHLDSTSSVNDHMFDGGSTLMLDEDHTMAYDPITFSPESDWTF
ncbi:unnamed protein product [Dovyalis caffra]|uniref:LOB domain-containing protein n=1 Tax=Dovyalis caffra TaxID=77055 RepID=A0AAV1SH13_9ROSI|nr:unnamed protein product [Dovyalis caffra]